ncbi:uncharacterized protein [Solanum tuberosum]|uniref:uncharacterized protein n=1 Tax=Solanum tuberosum TaxID=4113 RepID=UPI00073A0B86|nr:PREDICTED: uncharacterized protein LOC107059268 [Solanum tuberosum]
MTASSSLNDKKVLVLVSMEEFAKISQYHKSLKEPTPVNAFTESCLITHSNKWVIDSGVTNHMKSNPNVFSSFQSHKASSSVAVADGSTCNNVGYGIVKPTSSITLSFVLSLPKFAFILIYVSKVAETLIAIYLSFPDHYLVRDLTTNQVIGKGHVSDDLYILDEWESQSVAFSSVSSCVDTPSQNGVVERKNRHLLETARALLFQMKVPKLFWADAVSTSCFLINRMPSTVLVGNTPYNVLFPNKSLYPVEPKVFRSICYVRDVRPSVTKLDPKALKCVFLGYSRLQKGYRCYSTELGKYLLSIDVVFSETTPFFYAPPTSISQGEEVDAPVRSPDPSKKLDLPIALHKGARTCKSTYSIANFVSYDHLSSTSRSLIASLDSISIPKTVKEALNHPG